MRQADRPTEEKQAPVLLEGHRRHDRHFLRSKYVYPVLSRRSQGISVGINLNPDGLCNFDCVYCQVQREESTPKKNQIDVDEILSELKHTIDLVKTGQLFEYEPFRDVPAPLRKLKDVAFSGDGEPTTCRDFPAVVQAVVNLLNGEGIKIVLITNASQLHRRDVRQGVDLITSSGGEVWGKLDAGTQAYYQAVNRCATPFDRILENLTNQARHHPIVIQSLFLELAGDAPADQEIDAYCERLNQIKKAGGQIDRVQIHTIARPPAESFVAALPESQLELIRQKVQDATGLTLQAHA